eukprot:2524273-Rhodomonas_salina.1
MQSSALVAQSVPGRGATDLNSAWDADAPLCPSTLWASVRRTCPQKSNTESMCWLECLCGARHSALFFRCECCPKSRPSENTTCPFGVENHCPRLIMISGVTCR